MAAEPERWMLHVPSSTAAELVRSGVLDASGVAVWSLWDGYLKEPPAPGCRSCCAMRA